MEWGFAEQVPKVRMLSGEQHREFVLSPEEEARYLSAAFEPLASVATVLADNGRHGSLFVTHGKTAAARRVLPMTPRVRSLLEARWNAQGRPAEGYAWPAPSKSDHVEPSGLKKQHAKALRLSRFVRLFSVAFVTPFSPAWGRPAATCGLSHGFAGHSSIAISARYVHPSEDAVLTAMSRLSGHNSGHSEEMRPDAQSSEKLLSD
jgi:hypothetical protein